MNPDKCRYSTPALDEPGTALCADDPADFLAAGKAAAKSANTLATYRSAWKSWTRWARANQLPADRPDPHQIQQWLADLYSDGKAIDTLRTYRAGIAWHLRLKAAAEAAGINPTGISSHSTRVGMAQDLTAAGIDLLGLMHAGR